MPQPAWSEYQALFRSFKAGIWLNHAGVSPTSQPVAEAIEAHAREVMESGWMQGARFHANLRKAKTIAAKLLGCRAEDLSGTPNTTHGINLIANGLHWEPGDQVVLSTKEYPANVYPWWAQQSKGVSLQWVEPDREGRLPVEFYESKITEKTRVVTVSHVQFATGYRHDLKRLGDLCKAAGTLLFVDAIQSFSVFPIDIEGCGIDALTTGSHKWLLGPTGIALFYATPKLREELETTYVGADCMVDADNYLDYRFELLPDGRRFENAMLNFGGIAGLLAALEVVERFGRDRIEAEIRKSSDRMVELAKRLDFTVACSRAEEEWSGILTLTHPQVSPQDLAKRLSNRNISTSIRDGRLRVSPHAYFTDSMFAEIEEAFESAVTGKDFGFFSNQHG